MSDKVGEWQLDDLKDSLDVREVYDDSFSPPKVTGVQVRDHWVLARHRKLHASQGFASAKGTMSANLDYYVGSHKKTKMIKIRFDGSVANAGDQYLCIEHGFSPEQPGTPGEYVIERQTWEFYSAWRDAPAAWNLVETT
jgi:hypothetical protein